MAKGSIITVRDVNIRTMTAGGIDYICITDIARQKNETEPKDVVKNWMRQKNTLEYLGLWERLHNPNFIGVEFDPLLAEAGSNAFTMSPTKPYRPLSDTSSFNDYAKEAFNDDAQIRLKEYCDHIDDAGFQFMLSNSDCKGKNEEDNFFDVLYGAYYRARIYEQNGTPNIVIRNYQIQESWQR